MSNENEVNICFVIIMTFHLRMKRLYVHFCNQICIVEVMFHIRTYTLVLATVFEIFYLVICILNCI